MKFNKESCCVILLLFAVLGLALASGVYIRTPDSLHANFPEIRNLFVNTAPDLSGTLLPLVLVLFGGFFMPRLSFFALLTLLRAFSLTMVCYLAFESFTNLMFFILLFLCAIKLYLFVSFCRLAFLFGKLKHKQKRFTRQFLADFLFFCGISAVFYLIPHLLEYVHRQYF